MSNSFRMKSIKTTIQFRHYFNLKGYIMQNVIQNFARHRSVGECVEAIFHALGVQNDGVDSKRFE